MAREVTASDSSTTTRERTSAASLARARSRSASVKAPSRHLRASAEAISTSERRDTAALLLRTAARISLRPGSATYRFTRALASRKRIRSGPPSRPRAPGSGHGSGPAAGDSPSAVRAHAVSTRSHRGQRAIRASPPAPPHARAAAEARRSAGPGPSRRATPRPGPGEGRFRGGPSARAIQRSNERSMPCDHCDHRCREGQGSPRPRRRGGGSTRSSGSTPSEGPLHAGRRREVDDDRTQEGWSAVTPGARAARIEPEVIRQLPSAKLAKRLRRARAMTGLRLLERSRSDRSSPAR